MLINNLAFNVSKQFSLEDDAKRLRDVVTRLSLLQIDHTEYACLKALVLFKSGKTKLLNHHKNVIN